MRVDEENIEMIITKIAPTIVCFSLSCLKI